MKTRLVMLVLGTCIMAVGQPASEDSVELQTIPQSNSEQQLPEDDASEAAGVEDAIPAPVKALGVPAMMNFPGGIAMAVTASSEQAQAHVLQGLNHLLGGWEFEASRHFAAALREDPECLLAHWGMIMTMLSPTPETGPARNVATDRLLDLVDQGKGTELERGYAYGLIQYVKEGPAGAAVAFRKVAARFPNEMMAAIFTALFDRSGYDVLGNATPSQEVAEKSLQELIEKFPQSSVPLHALLTIRAEANDLNASLPLAQKLCQLVPDYAPYFHLLGHYEWRCGNHGEAAAAFGKASTMLESWMEENNATLADCPEWVKAECYRAVCLASKGEVDTAYAVARQLAATALPSERPASPGTRILLWDAKTLPARLLLQRGSNGDAAEALNSLPKPQDILPFHATSLAYWWIDGLRLALEARRLLDAGDIQSAKDVSAAMSQHGESMAKTQTAAAASGERSELNRSFRAMEVLASDVRGHIAMAGPKSEIGSAYNWFSSAAERQRPAPAMFPPLILTPMDLRVGDYFLKVNRPADAIEAYRRALGSFPNNMETMLALKVAYEASQLNGEAEEIEQRIQQLRAN